MASAGDRLQIVIGAKDELSGQLRQTKKEIRDLSRVANDMQRRYESGEQGVQGEIEQTRQHIERLRLKHQDLERQQKENNSEYKRLMSSGKTAAMNLTRSFDAVQRKLGFTETKANGLRNALERLDNSAYAFRAKWNAALTSVRNKMTALHSSSAFQSLMGFARGGIAAVGLIGGAAALTGATTKATLENQLIALEQLLGSKKKALETQRWIVEQAAATPFSLTDLSGATQKLLGFGFTLEDTKDKLLTIGDVAAGTGTGAEGIDQITRALGQMQAKQKITGEEMMQLTEAGIPAWKLLADQMGISTKELMDMTSTPGGGNALFEKGGLEALFKGMDKQYGGVMEKQARTLGGRWSTFTDTLRTELSKFFDGKSGKALRDLLKWAADEMPKAFKAMRPYVRDFVQLVKDNGPTILAVFKGIGWVIKNILWKWVTLSYTGVRKLIEFVVGFAKKINEAFQTVNDKVRGVKDFIVGVVQTIKDALVGIWDNLTNGLSEKTEQVKNWLKSMIPGLDLILFAGGPVAAGQTALVGEIGPELFIPNTGNPQMVGQGGPEIRDFHTSGVVIPNFLVGSYMAAQAAGGAATAVASAGVHIENLTVQDRFDARREFDALLARQRRIAAERS